MGDSKYDEILKPSDYKEEKVSSEKRKFNYKKAAVRLFILGFLVGAFQYYYTVMLKPSLLVLNSFYGLVTSIDFVIEPMVRPDYNKENYTENGIITYTKNKVSNDFRLNYELGEDGSGKKLFKLDRYEGKENDFSLKYYSEGDEKYFYLDSLSSSYVYLDNWSKIDWEAELNYLKEKGSQILVANLEKVNITKTLAMRSYLPVVVIEVTMSQDEVLQLYNQIVDDFNKDTRIYEFLEACNIKLEKIEVSKYSSEFLQEKMNLKATSVLFTNEVVDWSLDTKLPEMEFGLRQWSKETVIYPFKLSYQKQANNRSYRLVVDEEVYSLEASTGTTELDAGNFQMELLKNEQLVGSVTGIESEGFYKYSFEEAFDKFDFSLTQTREYANGIYDYSYELVYNKGESNYKVQLEAVREEGSNISEEVEGSINYSELSKLDYLKIFKDLVE